MSTTMSSWRRLAGRSAGETGPKSGHETKRARRVALAGGIVGALLVTGGPGVAGPAPAGAQTATTVRGLEKVSSPVETNSSSFKSAVAKCPSGKSVVGGGGWAHTLGNAEQERLTLTELRPSADVDGFGTDGYVASATETSPGVGGDWWMQAYALCADPSSLPGWNINPSYSPYSSSSMKAEEVGCDNSGQRVIGTGARIAYGSGQVGLQVARVSGPGDITRAQAHEDVSGYAGSWYLAAYAICVDTPSGYQVVSGESDGRASETYKLASAGCPIGKQMLSSGAAISNVAPGNATLQVVYPYNDLRTMQALAYENTPTSLSWDFIIARGVCVNAP